MIPKFDNTVYLIEEFKCVLKGQGVTAEGLPFDLVYDPENRSLFIVSDENPCNTEVFFEPD